MPPSMRALFGASIVACLVPAMLAGCVLDDFTERPLPYASAPEARVERGRLLMAQYQCGSCHAIPRVPIARGMTGPPLDAFGRRSYIAGHLPNGPDLLTRWIVAPASLVPDTTMPSMGVSTEDARDMAAYLLSLG